VSAGEAPESIGDAVGGKEPPVRGVMYIRMSTEHQQYSPENQRDVMAAYAAQRGIAVVGTYSDGGKSGLLGDRRDALQRLIQDATGPDRSFDAILVYDVSRWGRFQHSDQHAYYEYLCWKAGVQVHYCAEQFRNDGSMSDVLMKGIKRVMAGEYSRELSAKVFQGQCRLIELGFRQGGTAGYGLRRVLVDHTGTVKGTLVMGEHKSIQTDRVVLHPGPSDEVAIVRWIYDRFVTDRMRERQIAEELNARGVQTDLGRPWTRATVHQVLTNEKYVGNNVYNRVSFKLKQKRVRNRPDQYVRAIGAFAPIVDADVFTEAQAIIAERSRRLSDEEMLAWLGEVYRERGYLSALVIDECEQGPSSSSFRARFGSLVRAYQLVGYHPGRDYAYLQINRRLRQLHPRVVAETVGAMEAAGALVTRDEGTDLLTINEEFTLSLVISRCIHLASGAHRWVVRLDRLLSPDVTVAVRMDADNEAALDYYTFPATDITSGRLRLAEANGLLLDAYRYDDLEHLIAMTRRVRLEEVACQ
jgi:DNA invertase Pin-like site-specific DNA recombinase